MDIVATQKHVIASPRKLREVVYLIRKFSPTAAIERLPFTGKRASGEIRKVVMTAVANAKVRGLNADQLEFKEIQINEGPRLKRFRAGSRGRAKPYKKRMSHIRVVLTTRSEARNSKSETNSNVSNSENVKEKEKGTTENKKSGVMSRAKSMLIRKEKKS